MTRKEIFDTLRKYNERPLMQERFKFTDENVTVKEIYRETDCKKEDYDNKTDAYIKN